jgi:hypothetical protein
MKTQTYAGIIVLAAIGVGTVLLVLSRTGTAARHSDKEWNELNAKVERLEQTTTRLQKELDEARKPVPNVATQPAEIMRLPAAANLTATAPQMPAGSMPFMFNGVTYYLTPLAQAR